MKRSILKQSRLWLSAALFLSSFLGFELACLPTDSAADTLTVTIDGAGSVNSSPGGIACTEGNLGTCSASFGNLTEITLTASETWRSLTGMLTGTCSGVGSCTFNINGDTTVTAAFPPNYQAKVMSMSMVDEYATLGEAYAAVEGEGTPLNARVSTFEENLSMNSAKTVKFYGGMDASYLNHVTDGFTTLQGSLEIQQGTLMVDSLTIQ